MRYFIILYSISHFQNESRINRINFRKINPLIGLMKKRINLSPLCVRNCVLILLINTRVSNSASALWVANEFLLLDPNQEDFVEDYALQNMENMCVFPPKSISRKTHRVSQVPSEMLSLCYRTTSCLLESCLTPTIIVLLCPELGYTHFMHFYLEKFVCLI